VACGAGAAGGIGVVLSGRKPTWGTVAAGAAFGCVGGLAVLGGVAVAGAAAIPAVMGGAASDAAAAASAAAAAVAGGRLSVIPKAAAKLGDVAGKFRTTADVIIRAAEESNARFIDLLPKNLGNINIFLPRPDGAAGFIRVTTNPSGTTVISGGLMRAGQVGNGIANGRFVPVE